MQFIDGLKIIPKSMYLLTRLSLITVENVGSERSFAIRSLEDWIKKRKRSFVRVLATPKAMVCVSDIVKMPMTSAVFLLLASPIKCESSDSGICKILSSSNDVI